MIELETYSPVEKTAWWLSVLATGVASLRLWDMARFGINKAFIGGLILSGLCFLVLSALVRKRSSIDSATLQLQRSTSILRWQVHCVRKDISAAQWIRARLTGSYRTKLIIEVGTPGYEVTELLGMPYRGGDSVPKAEALCHEIAEKLNLQNKGYRGEA